MPIDPPYSGRVTSISQLPHHLPVSRHGTMAALRGVWLASRFLSQQLPTLSAISTKGVYPKHGRQTARGAGEVPGYWSVGWLAGWLADWLILLPAWGGPYWMVGYTCASYTHTCTWKLHVSYHYHMTQISARSGPKMHVCDVRGPLEQKYGKM